MRVDLRQGDPETGGETRGWAEIDPETGRIATLADDEVTTSVRTLDPAPPLPATTPLRAGSHEG